MIGTTFVYNYQINKKKRLKTKYTQKDTHARTHIQNKNNNSNNYKIKNGKKQTQFIAQFTMRQGP